MTPKEKAEELVIRYLKQYAPDEGEAIIFDNTILTSKNQFYIRYFANCALIAVDEILSLNAESFDELPNPHHYFSINYWLQVKQEIEKL